MKKLDELLGFIETSSNVVKNVVAPDTYKSIEEKKNNLLKIINEDNCIKVPIVGNFNAGKSALLNTLLGRGEILPENIQPETAIPYEIYPQEETEIVELYREGVKIHECSIEDIRKLNDIIHIGDIAKVFINNNIVRDLAIKGITLVDMPGSDSGIKAHNEAILNYINNGSVFVFLLDVSKGSLSKSNLAYLQELQSYAVSSSVFLSKCDLLPESARDSVKEFVTYQIAQKLQGEVFLGCVSILNIDDFKRYLDSLCADTILFAKIKPIVSDYVEQIINGLSASQMAATFSPAEMESEIAKLEKQKQAIREKLQVDTPENADTPEKSTLDILEMVKEEINKKAEVIAESIVNREPESEISSLVLSILRPVIIKAITIEGEQYAGALKTVVDEVSEKLIHSINIDSNLIDSVVDDYKESIQGVIAVAAEMLKNNSNVYARIIGSILTLVGDQIPSIIRWVLGNSHVDIVKKAAGKIRTSLYPSLQNRLYPTLLDFVKEQQKRIRDSVKEKVEVRIKQVEDAICMIKEKGFQEREKADQEVLSIEEIKKSILSQYNRLISADIIC